MANRNAPGQVVVSGERAAIEAGAEIAKELGAKRAIVLPVSVAAHSPLMTEAAEGMRETLADVTFHDPSTTLLANADGRPITTADGARAELVEHLTAGRRLGRRRRAHDRPPASRRSSRSAPARS